MARRARTRTAPRENIGALLAEVATLDSDMSNPAVSGIYRNPDRLASQFSYSSQFYDEIEQDAHTYAVLQKRKQSVIACRWTMTPGGSARADALCKAVVESIGLDGLTMALLDSILTGFSVVELMYEREGDAVVPVSYIHRASRRFRFDADYGLRLITKAALAQGAPVPERKFLVATFGGRDGNPYGAGLGTKLLALVRIKRGVLQRHAEYAQRVANGTAVATVLNASGLSDSAAELGDALELAQTMIDSGVIATTESVELKLLEPSGTAGDVFIQLVGLLNDEITKCVLGELGTTELSGTLASATVHAGQRLAQTRADADNVSETLNQMLAWICEVNFGPQVVPPQVYREVGEAAEFAALIQRDLEIAKLGVKPSLEYIQATYGAHWQPGDVPGNAGGGAGGGVAVGVGGGQ